MSGTTVEKQPASGSTPTPKQIEEDDDGTPCVKDDPRPRCLFDFDEDGEAHTETGEAERTFSFPKIKVGWLADFRPLDMAPFMTLEVVDWWMFGEGFSIDAGAAQSRVILSLSYKLLPLLDIGPTIWGGINIKEKLWTGGVGVTMLKF